MEDNKTFTSRAERVQANLDGTLNNIREHKLQSAEVSLSIIAQCQIDISYTLALILDEMQTEKQAIPLDKIKQAREKIEPYVYEDKYDCINDDMTGWICASEVLLILDKLIAESEG
jgi:hypothetical protein